jgi:GMP synthase (glutamine-hydrolysing)
VSQNVLLITHEQTESTDTGIVERVLLDLGHTVQTHNAVALDSNGSVQVNLDFPSLDKIDAIIAFGSFSHVYAETSRYWVEEEVAYISEVRRRGIRYLGICFGAQLLAESLGGRTIHAARLEAGVIRMTTAASLPIASGPWFSWHNDKVELPEHVEILASTELAPQVFRSGNAVGLQFHPEVTRHLLDEWIRLGADELGETITAEEMRSSWAEHEAEAHGNSRQLLEWFLGLPPTAITLGAEGRPASSARRSSPPS